jgi:hypothetical protein
MKEIFFDDDTFNYRKDRTIELCKKLKAAQLYVVLHVARHDGLRHVEGDERSGLPAADCGLRIGRPADSEEHQEGRHGGHGGTLHGELQEAGVEGPRRLYHRAAGRNAESIRKTIDFAKRLDNETIRFRLRIRIRAPSSTTTSKEQSHHHRFDDR